MVTHSIESATWRDISFGEKLALTCIHMTLGILKPDEKMSVLLTAFRANLLQEVEREVDVDAVIETLRMQLHADLQQQRETQQ